MTEWAAKRFWTDTNVTGAEDGYAITLDGRPVNSPGKKRLVLPTRRMAEAVASEWDAQVDVIDPRTMPWTRSANSALDKVAPQRDAVIDHLADYAGTDMVCYRADHPAELIERQAAAWDPLIAQVAATYGAALAVTKGVMPIVQSAAALAQCRAAMSGMTAFQLTGFHDLVTLPGSFAVALAAINDWQTPEDLWQVARLDELWQIEQWGPDEEAEELAKAKQRDFLHAAEFYRAACSER